MRDARASFYVFGAKFVHQLLDSTLLAPKRPAVEAEAALRNQADYWEGG